MYQLRITHGGRELDRFDGLQVRIVEGIELEKERQKTERLRLLKRVATLAIVLSLFGGAIALGQEGLATLKDLIVGACG